MSHKRKRDADIADGNTMLGSAAQARTYDHESKQVPKETMHISVGRGLNGDPILCQEFDIKDSLGSLLRSIEKVTGVASFDQKLLLGSSVVPANDTTVSLQSLGISDGAYVSFVQMPSFIGHFKFCFEGYGREENCDAYFSRTGEVAIHWTSDNDYGRNAARWLGTREAMDATGSLPVRVVRDSKRRVDYGDSDREAGGEGRGHPIQYIRVIPNQDATQIKINVPRVASYALPNAFNGQSWSLNRVSDIEFPPASA